MANKNVSLRPDLFRRLFGLILLSTAAATTALAADKPAATLRTPRAAAPAKPAGVSDAAWNSIMQQVQRELYAAEANKAGDLEAYNYGQKLSLNFTKAGPSVTPRAKENTLQFNLLRYGYGSALSPVNPVAPVAQKNRIEYRHGPIVEWYVNQAAGLEQGFTLSSPPTRGSASPAAPLRLEIGVKTALTASSQPNGASSSRTQREGGTSGSRDSPRGTRTAGPFRRTWSLSRRRRARAPESRWSSTIVPPPIR